MRINKGIRRSDSACARAVGVTQSLESIESIGSVESVESDPMDSNARSVPFFTS